MQDFQHFIIFEKWITTSSFNMEGVTASFFMESITTSFFMKSFTTSSFIKSFYTSLLALHDSPILYKRGTFQWLLNVSSHPLMSSNSSSYISCMNTLFVRTHQPYFAMSKNLKTPSLYSTNNLFLMFIQLLSIVKDLEHKYV